MNINIDDVLEVKTHSFKATTLKFEVKSIEDTNKFDKYTVLKVVRIKFAKDIKQWVSFGYDRYFYIVNETQKILSYPEYRNIGKLR